MKDTALKHLTEILSPLNKDKPIPPATLMYIKREEEKEQADPSYRNESLDLLRRTIEAKRKGETLKINLQSLSIESEPAPPQKESDLSLKITEANNLGAAFQYQALAYKGLGENMRDVLNIAISSNKEAYSNSNGALMIKQIFDAMLKANEQQSKIIDEQNKEIKQLRTEIRGLHKDESKRHNAMLNLSTQKALLDRQILELEEAIINLTENQPEKAEGEEESKEEKEIEAEGIKGMMQQVEGFINDAPGYMDSVSKARDILSMGKSIFRGLTSGDSEDDKKEEEKAKEEKA